jgi:hypothetical protein
MKAIPVICPTALVLLFSGVIGCFAQSPAPPVTLAGTEQRSLTSAKIGQRYDLLVSLPSGYATSGQSYPVLYILDGWHFPLMAFIQNNNIYSQRMAPVIMVNIGHSPAKDAMTLRTRDFTPTPLPKYPNSGGGPAFLDFLEHDRELGERHRQNFRKAVQAGVKLSFGTDLGVCPYGSSPKQFAFMVKYGMTPMQVIQAFSKTNSEILGIDKDYGTLAKGKMADLVVLDKNPLDDILNTRTVSAVYIGGKKFE